MCIFISFQTSFKEQTKEQDGFFSFTKHCDKASFPTFYQDESNPWYYERTCAIVSNSWIIWVKEICTILRMTIFTHFILFICPHNVSCFLFVCFLVFYTSFNNISVILWQSVLLVEETGGPGEKHWPVASHWQTLSHNVELNTPQAKKKKYMCVYCHMSKKSRVGRSALIFFFITIGKTGNSRSRFRNPIFHFRNFQKTVICWNCFMTSYTVFLPSLLSISTKS